VNLFTKILQNVTENHGSKASGMTSAENMLFRKTKEQAYRQVKVVKELETTMLSKLKKFGLNKDDGDDSQEKYESK
jgi:hypothetical protein